MKLTSIYQKDSATHSPDLRSELATSVGLIDGLRASNILLVGGLLLLLPAFATGEARATLFIGLYVLGTLAIVSYVYDRLTRMVERLRWLENQVQQLETEARRPHDRWNRATPAYPLESSLVISRSNVR